MYICVLFKGGTNFGFMNGANEGPYGTYLPTVTSYGVCVCVCVCVCVHVRACMHACVCRY